MITSELICFWSSAILLAAAFFLTLASLVFRKVGPFGAARALAAVAFFAITALGVIRWARTGHPPFVTLFESMITAIWFTLLIYHALSVRIRQSQSLLLPVSAVCFLLLGWASNLPPEASPLSAALTNVWLFIHASFATSGAAAFVIASAYATLFLLGQGAHARFRDTLKRAPEYDALPGRILNFLIFGLILWGIMIVSGSIWAHVAWGRYWAWDPIELWSLIGWILYALLLHARLTFKLSKRLFCWLTIIAALTVLFALWGVQYVYDTIHTYG